MQEPREALETPPDELKLLRADLRRIIDTIPALAWCCGPDVDERPDDVQLSYDRVANHLSPYGNAEALKVARDLDAKVEALLASAAG